jgi:hypothetical protein
MKAFLLHQRLFALTVVGALFGYQIAPRAASVDVAIYESLARDAIRSLSAQRGAGTDAQVVKEIVGFSDDTNKALRTLKSKVITDKQMVEKSKRSLAQAISKLAEVGKQVDSKFPKRAEEKQNYDRFTANSVGKPLDQALKVDQVIKDLCAAINTANQDAGTEAKVCDPKLMSEGERAKLLNLASKVSGPGESGGLSLESLQDQLAKLGYQIQDAKLGQLFSQMSSLHKDADLVALAASVSGSGGASLSASDSLMMAGLSVSPSKVAAGLLAGNVAKNVGDDWVGSPIKGFDPLVPGEGDFIQEPSQEKLASNSSVPEALADDVSTTPPASSTFKVPSAEPSQGFGFEPPATIASNDKSGERGGTASDSKTETSEHTLGGASDVAASTGNKSGGGNPYNDVNASPSAPSQPSRGPSSPGDAPLFTAPTDRTTGISDILTRGLAANAASGVGRAASAQQHAQLPETFTGTQTVVVGSPFRGGLMPAVVLGDKNEPDACKLCRPDGVMTLAPQKEKDCDQIFRQTFMTKNDKGQEILDEKRFFNCMNNCVAGIAYKDDRLDPSDPDSPSKAARVLTEKMNLMKPDPKPDSQEIMNLTRRLLATERLYSRGSCGALALSEDYFLKNKGFKKNNGCMTLEDSSFSVQEQFAQRRPATDIVYTSNRGVFESLFLTYQSGALATFQGTYPKLIDNPATSAGVFLMLQGYSKENRSEKGNGVLPNVLHNLTSCYKHDQIGGYLIAMDHDSADGLDAIFGCHDKEKIREALAKVNKHESLDPPCPTSDGKVTKAWERLQKAKPEDRPQIARIMNSIVSSHQFVRNITGFAESPLFNFRSPKVVQVARLTRQAHRDRKAGATVAEVIDRCEGKPTCNSDDAPSEPAKTATKVASPHSGAAHSPTRGPANSNASSQQGASAASESSPTIVVNDPTACLNDQLKFVQANDGKVGGDPKENFSKAGFAQGFAEAIQTEVSSTCLKSKEFQRLISNRERALRPQACACSHHDAKLIMGLEREQCLPSKQLGECGENLAEYSYLIGAMQNAGLKPMKIRDPGVIEEYETSH